MIRFRTAKFAEVQSVMINNGLIRGILNGSEIR